MPGLLFAEESWHVVCGKSGRGKRPLGLACLKTVSDKTPLKERWPSGLRHWS